MKDLESNKSTIGGRITSLRKTAGLTQKELAAKITVSRELVNLWENDLRQIKGDDIVRLADALETTCDYLLRGVSTQNLDVYTATGLTDEGLEAIQKIPINLRQTFCETLKSKYFYELLMTIQESVLFSPYRGCFIEESIMQLLKEKPRCIPPVDFDTIFKFNATDQAGKLFDEVSTRLYDEMESKRNGQHHKDS